MTKHKVKLTKEEIQKAIDSTPTMGAAANYLNLDRRTFKKEADLYDLYKPERKVYQRVSLDVILNGGHSHYPTSHLSKRLVKEGLKEYQCESCSITEYNGKHISLELNHKDGYRSNHSLSNLELLCPNCHSQTDTYRSKKLKLKNTEG